VSKVNVAEVPEAVWVIGLPAPTVAESGCVENSPSKLPARVH